MPCNDPLQKCAIVTPSGCVQWTGTLSTDSNTVISDCTISINDIIKQQDDNITLLLGHNKIKVNDLRDADVCSKIFPHIEDLKIKSTDSFVYNDKVVLELVGIVCDLQSQISTVHDKTSLNKDFFDLKLPSSIKNMLSCLQCDNGCDPLLPLTLKDFFEIIAKKIVNLPCEQCDGGCLDC